MNRNKIRMCTEKLHLVIVYGDVYTY